MNCIVTIENYICGFAGLCIFKENQKEPSRTFEIKKLAICSAR